ncbi:MAG: ATP-binding protein, partial [Myxococcota bacterium]
MTEVDVLAVAETWRPRPSPGTVVVTRRLSLPEALSESVALVVQGVRRCGKSTLLPQLVTRYGLKEAHCAFLNLEDPRLSNALAYPLLDALVDGFRGRHGPEARLAFFLDEIQAVPGWERWLRARLDRPDGSLFVITGSNASLLSGELGTVLTGRHLTVELFPFDLDEARDLVPDLTVAQFIENGGFPEPLRSPDGDRLRRQYFHDIVERDIRERIGARSSRPLRQVLQMAYEATGSELSLRRIAGAVGIAIDTVGAYLEAAENAYLLFGVPFFAFSERKRAHRSKKYYPVDSGLRRVVVTPSGRDRGKSLETATYLALRRRFDDICYWRGKGEVDFVVQHEGRITPYQV